MEEGLFKGLKHYEFDDGMILVAGSFDTDGSGDLTAGTNRVKGVSAISRTLGEYTLTVQNKHYRCHFAAMGALDGAPEMLKSYTAATGALVFDMGGAITSDTLSLVALFTSTDQ